MGIKEKFNKIEKETIEREEFEKILGVSNNKKNDKK